MGITMLILVIILLVFMTIVFSKKKMEMTPITLILFLIFFIIWMFITSLIYTVRIESSYDIVRHYELIEQMRIGGWDYVINDSLYKNLFVINFMMYLVSLTPYNNLIVAIPMTIDLLIMGYIIYDLYKDNSTMTFADILFTIVCFLSFFSLKFAFSGIRTNLAVSLGCMGIYLDYIKGNRKLLSILFYVSSLFVHYFAFVIIAIRVVLFFVKTEKFKKWYLIIFSYPLLTSIASMIYPINNSYLNTIIKQFLHYQNKFSIVQQLKGHDGSLLLIVLCMLLIIIISFLLARKGMNNNKNIYLKMNNTLSIKQIKINKFLFVVNLFSIAFLPNYLISERFLMVTSFALLFYLPNYIKDRQNTSIGLTEMLFIVCLIALTWDLFALFTAATGINPLAGIGKYFGL